MICSNKNGDVFLEFLKLDKEDFTPNFKNMVTHSLVIIEYKGSFLLVYNRFRNQWELAGGMIEPGEHPRTCAKRELWEESGQQADNLILKGIMKFSLQPDERIEYGALYSGSIHKREKFFPNTEIEKIVFWNKCSDIGYIDEIDLKLLEYR